MITMCFECGICHFRFPQRGIIRFHQQVEHEKKIRRQKKSLKKSAESGRSDGDLLCPICTNEFPKLLDLHRNCANFHPNRFESCARCRLPFASKSSFREHISKAAMPKVSCTPRGCIFLFHDLIWFHSGRLRCSPSARDSYGTFLGFDMPIL